MRKAHTAIHAAVVLSVVALAAGVVLGADAPEPAAVATASKVTIDNFSFSPATLTVAEGTTVTWTNRDDMPHTVVATDKSFASEALDTDQTFSYTFSKPGTFEYYCSIHPRMTGRVVVRGR